MNTTTVPATIAIAVSPAVMRGQTVSVVNARDLHAALGSQRQFANWITTQIERCGLVEGLEWAKDGSLNKNVMQADSLNKAGDQDSKRRGGQNKTEYVFTLDAAKQVAMSSNTPRGREVRLYFLECERQMTAAQQQHAAETAHRVAQETASAAPAADPVAVERDALRAEVERLTRLAKPRLTLSTEEATLLKHCRDSEAIKSACMRRVHLFGTAFFHEPDWREISNLALAGLSAAEIEEATRIDRSQIGRAIKEMVDLGILDRKQMRRARTLALREDPMERLLRHAAARAAADAETSMYA